MFGHYEYNYPKNMPLVFVNTMLKPASRVWTLSGIWAHLLGEEQFKTEQYCPKLWPMQYRSCFISVPVTGVPRNAGSFDDLLLKVHQDTSDTMKMSMIFA